VAVCVSVAHRTDGLPCGHAGPVLMMGRRAGAAGVRGGVWVSRVVAGVGGFREVSR
jgi:hypothetical protein